MNITSSLMAFVALFLAIDSFAQIQVNQSAKSLRKRLQDSPHSMNIYNLTESLKDERAHVNGFYNELGIINSYKLNDQWSLALYNIQEIEKVESSEMRNDWSYSEFRIARSGLLNQRDHGINLTAQWRNIYYPDHESRLRTGNNGSSQVRFIITRDLAPKWSFYSYVRAQRYFSNGTRNGANNRYHLRPYLALTYSMTDKLSWVSDFFWNMNWAENLSSDGHKLKQLGYFGQGITYKMSKDVSLTGIIYSYAMKDHDGRLLQEDWNDQLTYAVNWDLVVF